MNHYKAKVLIILGPTASGKTALAVKLAELVRGEIISADSRQVFRGMDIGSGKDLAEYGSTPYHLIDIRPAGGEYSVSDFQHDAHLALSDIRSRNRVPIICGGTGHYVKSLLDDYNFDHIRSDPSITHYLEQLPREILFKKIQSLGLWEDHHWESDSRRRMARAIEKHTHSQSSTPPAPNFSEQYHPLTFYVEIERDILISRIESRLADRLQSGLIAEVEVLIKEGVSHHRLERYGLEYKWVSLYLRGELDYQEMFQKLAVEIRRYAKRQMTFIRYLQKTGHPIEPITDPTSFFNRVLNLLSDSS